MFGLASHFCSMNTAAARLETERYQNGPRSQSTRTERRSINWIFGFLKTKTGGFNNFFNAHQSMPKIAEDAHFVFDIFWGLKSPGRKKTPFVNHTFDEAFGTVCISFPKASGGVPTAITLPGPACFIDCEVDSHVGARKHGLLTP